MFSCDYLNMRPQRINKNSASLCFSSAITVQVAAFYTNLNLIKNCCRFDILRKIPPAPERTLAADLVVTKQEYFKPVDEIYSDPGTQTYKGTRINKN